MILTNVLLALILLALVRVMWIQGEHTVQLNWLHDSIDGIDFDVRDIHQVSGAQRVGHREMLQQERLQRRH